MARKILLADDSVTAQNMGRRILSDAGYDVTTVNNGSAALKKIAESKPDLIVLDVYMPGYGGLEVCQRLREAPETARIPVLLTVGKLEPFKAEESRRVRADAFIVKPFEASELLTALTKLEDKIVPQSQPSRQSRFAKALAGVEEPNPSKEFGDSETGWKNRLSIPPPHSKSRGAVARESSAAMASAGDVSKTEEQRPAVTMKSGLEEALLSSLPQDVTAEEIAAIKAAAAAFSTPSDESSFRPQPVRDPAEAPTQEPIVMGEERLRESDSESISAVAQTESSATTAETTGAEPLSAGDAPTREAQPPAMVVSESDASLEPEVTHAETGKLHDDEVTAALASLAPANGHGETAAIERDAETWEPASRAQVPVTMAVAAAAQEFSGPRWIAEPVALTEGEATLILEQEMEKAFAAFAAADAARMSFASSREPYSYPQVAVAPATTAEAGSLPIEASSKSDNFETAPEEPAHLAVMSAEEPATPATELSAEPALLVVDAVSDSAVSEMKENAAYAAAAAASPSTGETTMAAEATLPPSQIVESPESVAPVPEASAREDESELAEAWANWRQIRESVIGSQIAEAVEPRETSREAQPESQPDTSSAMEEDNGEISNIVDSVLADLKPKLMAEIAKKMGKEKKK